MNGHGRLYDRCLQIKIMKLIIRKLISSALPLVNE